MSSSSSSSPSNSVLSLFTRNKPQLKKPHDAVMLAIHAYILSKGFKCVALDEADPIAKELLDVPAKWNDNAEMYVFQYSPPENNTNITGNIVLKAIVMDNVLSIHVVNKQDPTQTIKNIDLSVYDYVSKAAELNNYASIFKDLSGLLTRFDSAILSSFLPSTTSSSSASSGAGIYLPASSPPSNPYGPDSSDPLRVIRPPPSNDPLMIGGPRYPRPGPGYGDFDGDLFPGGQGGNLMGPNQFPGPHIPGGRGRGIPRFDPYGPAPGFGDPDNDHFQPPGGTFPSGAPRGGPGVNPHNPFL